MLCTKMFRHTAGVSTVILDLSCACAAGCCAQWFLLWRCADPIGRRVRSHVPQRLREGGEATQRRTTAAEGAGATEGNRGERKVLPTLRVKRNLGDKIDKLGWIKYEKLICSPFLNTDTELL